MDTLAIVAAVLSCVASVLSVFAAVRASTNRIKIGTLEQRLDQVTQSATVGAQTIKGQRNVQVGGSINAGR